MADYDLNSIDCESCAEAQHTTRVRIKTFEINHTLLVRQCTRTEESERETERASEREEQQQIEHLFCTIKRYAPTVRCSVLLLQS